MSRSFSFGNIRVRVRRGLLEIFTHVARIHEGVYFMGRASHSESGSIMHTLYVILSHYFVKLKLSLYT